MKIGEVKKTGVVEFIQLKEIVDNYKGNLEELCKVLKGHNLDNELFDLNYNHICVTIKNVNNKLKLLTSGIELYDSNENLIAEDFDLIFPIKTNLGTVYQDYQYNLYDSNMEFMFKANGTICNGEDFGLVAEAFEIDTSYCSDNFKEIFQYIYEDYFDNMSSEAEEMFWEYANLKEILKTVKEHDNVRNIGKTYLYSCEWE